MLKGQSSAKNTCNYIAEVMNVNQELTQMSVF